MNPKRQPTRAERLLQTLLERLNAEREVLIASAKAAHLAATHEESKAEDQYDTRGLEASYLAGAQAVRAEQLDVQILSVNRLLAHRERDESAQSAAVRLGSVIEVDADGKKQTYLLVSDGGGMTLSLDDQSVQVITPKAPLGEALLGRLVGETAEYEVRDDSRSCKILSIE